MQIDEDDIVYRREPRGRSSTELVIILAVGILAGSLMTDMVELAATKIVAQYELQKFNNEVSRANAKFQEDMNQIEAQSQANENARRQAALDQQETLRRQRILSSDECRFWTEMNERNPSQKSNAGVTRFCTL